MKMADKISSLDIGYQTGDLSIYPEAIDNKSTLHEAKNNAKTKLKQTLTFNTKIIIVDSTEGFPDEGLLRIGHDEGIAGEYELVSYTLKTENTFRSVKRGFGGSKQNTWYVGDIYVTAAVMAEHHNAVKDAVIQIEQNLGLETSPTAESLNGILKEQEVRFLAPKPIFRAFPTVGPPPLTVRFQNFTTGHIVRNFWDFGDGTTSVDRSPEHTYFNEGEYTVKLNVITSTGAQGIATKTDYVVVSEDEALPFMYVDSISAPYSVYTATILTGQGDPTSPKDFLFVDQTDGDIVQRNWIFGDGETLTQNDPDVHTANHIYTEPNPNGYSVSCIIIFSNGRTKRVELKDKLIVL